MKIWIHAKTDYSNIDQMNATNARKQFAKKINWKISDEDVALFVQGLNGTGVMPFRKPIESIEYGSPDPSDKLFLITYKDGGRVIYEMDFYKSSYDGSDKMEINYIGKA